MIYKSPTKVARVVDFKKLSMGNDEIAQKIGIYRTTVTRMLKQFKKSHDPYYVAPKTGRPCKLDARMLAKTEVANAIEIVKKAFPQVSHHTLACNLKAYGLVCRVCRSRPYISLANWEKQRLWALAHASWTVEDWKHVRFLNESKFLLFKSDGRQYVWFQLGQALDDHFIKKNIKHGTGNLMVWGMITSKGMGRLHRINGIMCRPDYVKILEKQFLGSLKDLKIRCMGKEGL